MIPNDLITIDSEILGGTPVFKGTRVPVKSLFDYLEDNYTLEEFLECFPSVTREMACQILEGSEQFLLSASVKNFVFSVKRGPTNPLFDRMPDSVSGDVESSTGEIWKANQ